MIKWFPTSCLTLSCSHFPLFGVQFLWSLIGMFCCSIVSSTVTLIGFHYLEYHLSPSQTACASPGSPIDEWTHGLISADCTLSVWEWDVCKMAFFAGSSLQYIHKYMELDLKNSPDEIIRWFGLLLTPQLDGPFHDFHFPDLSWNIFAIVDLVHQIDDRFEFEYVDTILSWTMSRQ